MNYLEERLKREGEDFTNLGLKDFIGKNKKDLEGIYTQIANSKIFRVMGTTPDKSYLFFGPPGNGKTHAVECLWGELIENGHYISKFSYDIGKYGTAYINMGSRTIQSFFDYGQQLLKYDEYDGILYVFDECDVLLAKRGSGHGNKEDDKILETIMKNLQRIHDSDTEEYIFFMTNFSEALDEAALRSQRIDSKVEFGFPDNNSREKLWYYSINERNKKANYQVVRNFNAKQLANLSDGLSCSDITDIPRRAIKQRAMEIALTKTKGIIPTGYITQKRLIKEINELKPDKKIIGF